MIRRLLPLAVAATLVAPAAWAAPADVGPPDGWAGERAKLETQRRDPVTAAVLNGVWPGIGSAYVGDYQKAVIQAGGAFGVLLGSFLLSTAVMALTGNKNQELALVFAIAPYPAYLGWAVTDGYLSTTLTNERIDRKMETLTPISFRLQVARF